MVVIRKNSMEAGESRILQGFHLPEVSSRIVGRFNHAVTILLVGTAV